MSQVIGMVSADQGIEMFIYIGVVVLYDELLSITILGRHFVVTNSGVNISPHSDIIVEYFSGRSFLIVFLSFSSVNPL